MTTCTCEHPVSFENDGTSSCARCALPIADLRDTESRASAGKGAPPVVWALPWACPDCKAWGYIGVCVENRPERTSDELLERWVMGKHRTLNAWCVRPFTRMLLGRLRRREKPTTENPEGRMIFMLKKGETEHTPIDPRWPQWDTN